MNKFISVIIIFAFLIGSPVFSNPKGKGLWCKNIKSQNTLISLAENKFVEAVGAYFSSEDNIAFYFIEFKTDLYRINSGDCAAKNLEYSTTVEEIIWSLNNYRNRCSQLGISYNTNPNPIVKVNRKTLKLIIEGGGDNSEFQCEVAQTRDIFKQMSEEHRDELQGFYNQQLEGNKI